MLNVPEISSLNLTGLPNLTTEEDPSISGAYLGKSQGREDTRIKQEAQSFGLAPADPDPLAEAAQALRQPHPAYSQPTQSPQSEQKQPEQAQGDQTDQAIDKPVQSGQEHPAKEKSLLERGGEIIDKESAGRTWADDFGEHMKLGQTDGPVSAAYKSIGQYGVGIFRSFAEGTKGFFQSLDNIANGIADKTGADKGQLFPFLVKGADYWVKQMDKLYATGWDQRVKDGQIVSLDKFLNGIVFDLVGGAVPGMSSFMLDLGGLAPVKGAVRGGVTGAVEETAKVMFMDQSLKASQYLPYVLRAAGMGGLFAADSYAQGAQSIPELTAAVGTGAGFAAMGPRQRLPEVKSITPYEAAQFPNWMFDSKNMAELARAVKAGEITPQMEEMGRYFSTIFPGRDESTALKVVNELRLASEKTLVDAGYQGQQGIVLGMAGLKLEGEGLKAAIELYLGADVGTVIHEHGHLYFDALSPKDQAPLREWYQKETANEPNAPIFKEWVVDRFGEYFERNRLWEQPASRADGFGGVFGKFGNAMRGLIDKVRGVEGNSVPASVEGMFRAAGTGERGDVFSSQALSVAGGTSLQVKALAPEAQWENLRSWEKVGDEARPWEIVEKADQAGESLVRTKFDPVFGNLADRAVNINLSRLRTTDDIKTVISQVGESLRPQMEEARRYVRTDDMVQEGAKELLTAGLAGDLGMSEATLLQRQRGEAMNSEQALAARMILVSSAGELMRMAKDIQAGNNSDETLLAFRSRMETHTAIQAQVSGMTAEAGRALRSFRILAGESDIAPGLKLNPKDIQHIIEQTGGRGDIERMAETLAVLGETGENSMAQVNKAITGARDRTWKDWLFGYRYASMLSGVPTHLRNTVGNSLVAAMAIPERAIAHQLGVVSRFLGSNSADHVELNEARAMAFGYFQAQGEALKLASMAFKTGESQFGPQKVEQSIRPLTTSGETSPLEKTADMAWEAIQIPMRVLGAEDEYFKTINYRAELGAQAYRVAATEGLDGTALTVRAREMMNNPTEEMQRRSIDAAKNRTFNDDLDGAMRHISKGLSESVVGKWFVPFIRTPYNIFKYTASRTPLAPIFKGFRDDMAAGGARAELAMSQVIVGSSLMTLGASLAHMGVITGGGPSDPGERNVWLQNYQAYSVKVGENWYSYGNAAEPISTFLALASDFHDAATHWQRGWDNFGDASVWELSTALVKAFSKNITDKTFLKGVSDLVHVLDDPDRYSENILNSGASSFVPSYLGNWANAIDPEIKMVGGVLDALNNRIPWAKSELPPRRNLWGEPILSTEVGPSVAWWSPIKVKGDNATDIDREMLRLGMSVAMPKKEQGFRGVGVELTMPEFSRFMELTGQEMTMRRGGVPMNLKDHLNDFISSSSYQRLVEKSDGPDGFAALAIRDIIQNYQARAREALLEENPRIQDMVRSGIEDKRRAGQ